MKEQGGEDGVKNYDRWRGERKRDAENCRGSALTGILLRKWEEARKVAPDENQACRKICERLKKEEKQAQQKKRLSGGGGKRDTWRGTETIWGLTVMSAMACGMVSEDTCGWNWWGKWQRGMLEGRYKNGGETDDSRGLHWSASGLWMTKYGAVGVLLGLLGHCSRVWCLRQRNVWTLTFHRTWTLNRRRTATRLLHFRSEPSAL